MPRKKLEDLETTPAVETPAAAADNSAVNCCPYGLCPNQYSQEPLEGGTAKDAETLPSLRLDKGSVLTFAAMRSSIYIK